MNEEGIGGDPFAGLTLTVPEKADFAEGFATAVGPEVEAAGTGGVGGKGGGNDEGVGLDAVVDFGDIAADDEAGGVGPGGAAGGEFFGASKSLFE